MPRGVTVSAGAGRVLKRVPHLANRAEAITGDDELRARTRAGGTAAMRALAAEADITGSQGPTVAGARSLRRGRNPAPALAAPTGQPPAGINATSPLSRDPQYPACAPTHPAVSTWQRRSADDLVRDRQ